MEGNIQYFKPEELKEMTANRRQEFTALLQKLKKKKPKNLDSIVHDFATTELSKNLIVWIVPTVAQVSVL